MRANITIPHSCHLAAALRSASLVLELRQEQMHLVQALWDSGNEGCRSNLSP